MIQNGLPWSFSLVQSNRSLVNRQHQKGQLPFYYETSENLSRGRGEEFINEDTSFIPSTAFLLFEGKIQALETECRQSLVLFLACCCFTVPVPLKDWE